MRTIATGRSHTSRFVACAIIFIASFRLAQAHPYASALTNDNGTIRFVMNEAGANITVVYNDGSTNANFNGITTGLSQPAGANSFLLGTNHTGYRIICAKNGTGVPTLISSDSFTNSVWNSPRGLAVNQNPKVGNLFGRIYAGNSIAGGTIGTTWKGLGLYAMNADQTDALGKGTNASGNPRWLGNAGGTTIVGSSPWRMRVAPDNTLLVVDSTAAGAALWQFQPDLSSSNQMLGG